MNLSRFPLGKPLVEVEADGREYPFTVARDFVYLWPGFGKWSGFPVCIPKGYQTDFLSIPRFLWPILSPTGSGCWGALPHDILYSSEFGFPGQSKADSRAMADRVLFDAATDSGASGFRAGTLYSGVRAGGWKAWLDHKPQTVTDDLQSLAEATERWERTHGRLVA